MNSTIGYMQMGDTPVAGRVRAMHVECVAGRPAVFAAAAAAAASHASWLAGSQTKPQTTRIAVPDTNGNRRSRGTP
jgi:hypothetical protein